MASGWEMGMGGVEYFGMGMGVGMGAATFSNAVNIATPITTASGASPAYLYGLPTATDALRIDDLLDFSNQEAFPAAAAAVAAADNILLPPPEPSSAITGGSSSSDFQSNFQRSFDELYFPSEEAAELEWLSTFVDDSFSDVVPYPQSSAAAANLPPPAASAEACHLRADVGTAGGGGGAGRGARSKRGRAGWSAFAGPRPQPQQQSSPPSSSSSSSSSEFPSSKPRSGSGRARKGPNGSGSGSGSGGDQQVGLEGGVRRCTHCASEKTPQWRTGPLGPKTLCNACGVRYKSGRLVPEYRPAASPTFVLTQHSNSHRKVMELRRQKELLLLRHRDAPTSAAAAAAADLIFHDYGVC